MLKWCLAIGLLLGGPVAAETKVLAFSGSTREDSFNKKLVQEAAKMAQQMGATVKVIDLRDYPLPHYDGDLEVKEGMPENAKRLRQLMIESQAIIIASPEYNSSVSSTLKNVLDWASRNEEGKSSREAFKGKKFAIMSTSPGKGGGARGLVHLRAIIEDVGGEVVKQQVTVPQAHSAFNAQGVLENPELKEQLKQEIQQIVRGNGESNQRS